MTITFKIVVCMILFVAVVMPPVKAEKPPIKVVNHDDTTVGSSPNDEIKCGTCPCGTTCNPSPPPPTPSPPPPSPPPPPKKQTPTPGANCPPPPYSGGGGGGGKAPPTYIYIAGPPGDLYPVVQSVSSACRCVTAALILVTSGLLGMLAFW